MKLLLDSHAFLWALQDSPKLSARARAAIQDASNVKLVSFASLWEITIKVALGKLKLDTPWEETLQEIERLAPGTVLGCRVPHLKELLQLPRHHGDPFDRMIVAQARVEQLTLVSNDELLDAYGIQRLW